MFARKTARRTLLGVSLVAMMASGATAADFTMALADDPDALDEMTNRSQVGITVLNVMCEGLLTTDSDLNFVPGLAQSWEWSEDGLSLTMQLKEGVTYQDGTAFDAESVKFNIERYLNSPNSQRASDLSSIASVEVTSPSEVVIHTSEPAAQLLAKFAMRSGHMMSPAAIAEYGEDIGANPVCAGPYAFSERVAQDRIVLTKYADYYDADSYAFDKVTFRIIPDDSVRLANLQSGDVDLIEKVDPSVVETLKAKPSITVEPVKVLNNQAVMWNLEADTPFKDAAVRNAFELAIDRNAINQVAFAGLYTAGNQVTPPGSMYYAEDHPMPARDPEAAKAMLAEAGVEMPLEWTLLVPNRPLSVRVAEMIQAMTMDAGFDTKLNVVDFATTLQMTEEGNFTAWGPIGPQFANDPDAVAFQVLHSTGGRNLSRYINPEVDALLEKTRTATDPEQRVAYFKQVAAIVDEDEPVTYVYHMPQIYAWNDTVDGLDFTGDGFLRIKSVTAAE